MFIVKLVTAQFRPVRCGGYVADGCSLIGLAYSLDSLLGCAAFYVRTFQDRVVQFLKAVEQLAESLFLVFLGNKVNTIIF
jgi:hypothetical protein